jgi:adenylate cyclase
MGVEIERKFLVKPDLWQNVPKPEGKYLRQGYLVTDPEKTIRVRVKEDSGYLTIKGKSEGATRDEFEYPIPKADAEELLDKFAGVCIAKIRYEIPVAGKLWEIDEFRGENEGLLVAEIELTDEAENFTLPEWAGAEVTGDLKYYNSRLTQFPYKNW